MKPQERPWRVRVAQTGHVKQKVIRGMGDRNCVQSDDTWRQRWGHRRIVASPLLRGDAFFLELRCADQPVAQKAAALRRNRPDNAKDIGNLTRLPINLDLRADLNAGDQVLMNDRIKQESRPHSICRQKQKITVGEPRCNIGFKEIVDDSFDSCARICAQDIFSASHQDLWFCKADGQAPKPAWILCRREPAGRVPL